MAIGELKVNVMAKIPTQMEMLDIAKQVEDEMGDMPITSVNVKKYVTEVRDRIAEKIEVQVFDAWRHPTIAGITSGK
jgi:hypothetical protein